MAVQRQKIIYVANVRMPTEKAHGIQIAAMCAALGRVADVTLLLPNRFNHIRTDIFTFYRCAPVFIVKFLSCIDTLRWSRYLGRLAYWIEAVTFAVSVWWVLRRVSGTVVYTRDLFIALIVPSRHVCVYEAHGIPAHSGWVYRFFLRRVDRVVAITTHIRQGLVNAGYPLGKVLVAPDGVDFHMFDSQVGRESAREQVGLSRCGTVALYAGHLYAWKGVDVVLAAAQQLPDIQFVFIGGTDADVARFRLQAAGVRNVHVLGHKPHHDVALFMRAADVLVLPNSAKEKISSHYTSPMKLFEYMASRTPIIASDLPSLRDIVNETMVTFFVPDSVSSFVEQLTMMRRSQDLMLMRSARAYDAVKEYTWERRTRRILDFLS